MLTTGDYDKMLDAYSGLKFHTLLPPGSRVASVNGDAFDISDFEGTLALFLTSGAGSGGNTTLDVKIQESDDGASWSDVSGKTFTQVTNSRSNEAIVLNTQAVGQYIRAVATQGAGSTFVYSVQLIGRKQYN